MKKLIYIVGKNSNLSKNLIHYLKNAKLVDLRDLKRRKKKLKISKFL